MAQTAQLSAELRTVHGTGEMRRLRRAGRTPAVIYGHGREPAALSVNSFDLGRLLESISPASTIVDLTVEGATYKTLIREVQRHPLRPGVTHVDFYEVKAGEKITLEVPVHLVGIPDGVRNQGGTLDQVLRMVAIEVLPGDIPERVELDVTVLTIGKSLPVSALVIPNAKILTDAGLTVCTVVAPRVEEVAAPVAAAAVEGEVVEGAEGAAPAAPTGTEPSEPELIRKRKPAEDEEEK
ncbi:MAG: 50S ribosomal protein L25 [Gemmatimonadales bacterium]|jgi:large subunit ribosomal protein L25